MTDAIRNNDDKALTAILGSTWHEFAPGSDQDDDEIRAASSSRRGTRSHKIMPEGRTRRWSASAPPAGWRRSRSSSRATNGASTSRPASKEMQARLIGRNELAVVQTLLAIVDAQRDYAAARSHEDRGFRSMHGGC